MTKADKVLIVILMVLSLVLVFPLFFLAPASNQATVLVENKEVLRIDLNKDESYSVQGKLGKVKIQVKDGKVRVSQEKSKHHLCSKQGYVSSSSTPIVCLPNETVVKIENQNNEEDTVIQ